MSGIRYQKKKESEAKEEGRPTHRNMRCPKLRLKKLVKDKTDKLMWYKPNPDNEAPRGDESITTGHNPQPRTKQKPDLRKTIAVMHMPRTPEGMLAHEISKAEQNLRLVCTTKVKVTERVGNTLKSLLEKSNP